MHFHVIQTRAMGARKPKTALATRKIPGSIKNQVQPAWSTKASQRLPCKTTPAPAEASRRKSTAISVAVIRRKGANDSFLTTKYQCPSTMAVRAPPRRREELRNARERGISCRLNPLEEIG